MLHGLMQLVNQIFSDWYAGGIAGIHQGKLIRIDDENINRGQDRTPVTVEPKILKDYIACLVSGMHSQECLNPRARGQYCTGFVRHLLNCCHSQIIWHVQDFPRGEALPLYSE
jgi:hypothetical protein